ncbi:MAG: hypothetical protein KVP17_002658 [Porospora cf. gigantea B]|uniref:uncharacterized protein n=1 Tax=Porospora cf. gigantea B TaxID=2853592 RepID=UPI003571B80C|nr:MAG: hypothetical protein KVP17_002658 [Porospora cf. gigantea B]
MKVFYGVFESPESEVVSDSYAQSLPFDMEEFKDVAFEVKGRYIDIGGEDYGIEDNDEDGAGGAAMAEKVVDIIHNFKLTDTGMRKKDFQLYLKTWMKELMESPKTKDKFADPDFKAKFTGFIKVLLGRFAELCILVHESAYDEGIYGECKATLVFSYNKDGEIEPTFVYLNDTLLNMKF